MTGEVKPARLLIVDGLRGYALFGLFIVHMTGYFELYNARPDPSWVQDTSRFLFQGKSFSLLALCFGFSFHAMLQGAKRRREAFVPRFGWRLAILLMMGWLHALIYRGDILVELAVAGLVLIPLDRIRSNRLLLAIAAAMMLQPFLILRIWAAQHGADWALAEPLFYDDGGSLRPSLFGNLGELVHANIEAGKIAKWSYFIETGRVFQVLGLFLVGLVIGRTGFFATPERFRRLRLWAGLAALVAIPPLALARDAYCCFRVGPFYWTNVMLAGWVDLAGMTLTLMIFIELWERGAARWLKALVPCGRMTLTLYVGQSLVFVPVYYGFGLHLWDRITQEESLALALAAFAAQLAFAHFWFRWFAYGPLEWLWRAGTRLSLDVPFRRRPEPLKAA